jgi:hypothetical protein
MINDFIRQFTRAWARGLGYQAARRTGWLLVPILIGAVVLALLGELDQLAQLWEWVRGAL